jgi:uncharacterized membrane protein YgdD (TMEM256/DUF423 family)
MAASVGTNIWVKMVGVSGLSAVALGAYGAHAILHRSEGMQHTWKTGSLYHLVHTCALAVAATQFQGRKRAIVSSLFATGILFFSGTCYLIVFLDQKQPYNMLNPIGGCLLLAGWAAFGFL